MVHICDCIPARIRQALAELPKTLDEAYERTLREIKEANWEFAHRMFQFVSVGSRPLHVKELADFIDLLASHTRRLGNDSHAASTTLNKAFHQKTTTTGKFIIIAIDWG